MVAAGGSGPGYLSTAGAFLKGDDGQQFMTVAAHGFVDLSCNDVYHPTRQGRKVGHIVARYPIVDTALVELLPNEHFQNLTFSNFGHEQSVLRIL